MSAPHQKSRSLSKRQQETLERALGPVRVLSVGVSGYPADSGYSRLPSCANDANAVADCFADVRELNSPKGTIVRIAGQSELRPTRGTILRSIRSIAESAAADNRIVFYYSGHGQRLGDEFYLVPEDVVSADDPDTLISFARLLKTLNDSHAKQKIVLIDSCVSGPNTREFKLPLANTSPKFLSDYVGHTTGVGLVASSSAEQASWARSPNPKLSLFTYFLVQALRGEPDSLNDGFLTLDSLCQFLSVRVRQLSKDYGKVQVPAWNTSTAGTLVLADFNHPVLPPAIDLEAAPVTNLEFDDLRKGRVDEVLKGIKQWHYSAEYLEKRVNENLGTYVEESFGKATAKLCSEFGFDAGQVSIEDSTLLFPGGSYGVTYVAEDLRTGTFIHTVSFDSDWFDHASDIPRLIKVLDLYPQRMHFELRNEIDVSVTVPGLRAKGWKLTSITNKQVEAEHSGYRVAIKKSGVTLEGFAPQEILGNAEEGAESKLVSGVLLLLGAK
jgi:hypothetical protein